MVYIRVLIEKKSQFRLYKLK